jgi:hypothetical protein
MALTVERKKKFLITMIVIMGCAVAINYGLFNILNPYFNTIDSEDTYSRVQLNMITVVLIIGIVTVIMVVLIPKETVKEFMNTVDKSGGSIVDGAQSTMMKLGDSDNDVRAPTPSEELQEMIDEELEDQKK